MLCPMLHLHRRPSTLDVDQPPVASDYYVQPSKIVDIDPSEGGGSCLMVECSGVEGGVIVDVNESPDMIAKLINQAIASAAKIAALGSIEGQLQATNELQRRQETGIVQARGIPPINGGR